MLQDITDKKFTPQISKSKQYVIFPFIIFCLINIFLYLSLFYFHSTMQFNSINYLYNAHHYKPDPRINHKSFSFFNALGQYDAQWYLKIAEKGYPTQPQKITLSNKKTMDGLLYAFFPLYPLILSLINFIFHNIELSAFMLANIFLIGNFFSLYKIITLFYPKNIAIRTIFLLFLFPFSIFYRSYFTEGLYLFLLTWSIYFFAKKRYIATSALLGLLLITKANGFLLNIFFIYYVIKKRKLDTTSWKKLLAIFSIMIAPLCLWIVFCFYKTHNPFYFITIRSAWFNLGIFSPVTIGYNLYLMINFFKLPLHAFHYSQVDSFMVFATGMVLFFSFKKIPHILWIVAFSLWLSPLLVTDTQSFSRYQSISFPMFLYLAKVMPPWCYKILTVVFFSMLIFISIAFVNWYWIG